MRGDMGVANGDVRVLPLLETSGIRGRFPLNLTKTPPLDSEGTGRATRAASARFTGGTRFPALGR
jgi:hypothetical protein